MATNCIRSVTTDDGTKIDITVDGKYHDQEAA